MLPLITRLDPPFRSVIWGGGPAGPVRPMGSVPPLFPNVHLRPAAKGWRNKAGGDCRKRGCKTQHRPAAVPSGSEGAEGVRATSCLQHPPLQTLANQPTS